MFKKKLLQEVTFLAQKIKLRKFQKIFLYFGK